MANARCRWSQRSSIEGPRTVDVQQGARRDGWKEYADSLKNPNRYHEVEVEPGKL